MTWKELKEEAKKMGYYLVKKVPYDRNVDCLVNEEGFAFYRDGTCEFDCNPDDKNFEELAKEKLPTEDGFFFGSTKYDEYYLSDLKEFLRFSSEWELDNTNVDYIYHPWY